jgi:hypothetical protein
MNDNKTYTVAEAAALPDESWINGTLEAHCIKIETIAKKAPKTGNFYKAHLSDGGSEALASMSLFMAPKFQAGDIIRLSGSGVKKGSYNGKAQFSTGKDTKIDVSPGTPKMQASVHGAMAEHANSELISGVQAGGAMKLALQMRSQGQVNMDQLLDAPGWWQKVHDTASDIIRVQRMLERGSLADPVRARHPQQKQTTQASRPPPTVEQELDEDVPF